MRFLIDESLPRAVGRDLAGAQHDVVDVRDIGLRGATDDVVAAHAMNDRRIIVSADLDFSNALRFPPRTHPGIVVARLPDTAAPDAIAARLLEAITEAVPPSRARSPSSRLRVSASFAARDRECKVTEFPPGT